MEGDAPCGRLSRAALYRAAGGALFCRYAPRDSRDRVRARTPHRHLPGPPAVSAAGGAHVTTGTRTTGRLRDLFADSYVLDLDALAADLDGAP